MQSASKGNTMAPTHALEKENSFSFTVRLGSGFQVLPITDTFPASLIENQNLFGWR
jgi:hypothetical protein